MEAKCRLKTHAIHFGANFSKALFGEKDRMVSMSQCLCEVLFEGSSNCCT